MPSFWDSGFIVLLALLLFGPKKLPVLARQLGKLMADFRRASNEFRTQMEEELRVSEQADRQKQIAALEAAAPKPALESASSAESAPEHSHIPPPEPAFASEPASEPAAPEPAPLPIATSGELNLMPPSTGLPVANTSLSSFVDSIPTTPDLEASNGHHADASLASETAPLPHGAAHEPASESEARPWMI
jgi:sec-independent protein translocase protein TatB